VGGRWYSVNDSEGSEANEETEERSAEMVKIGWASTRGGAVIDLIEVALMYRPDSIRNRYV
jgi:hypothetical protein